MRICCELHPGWCLDNGTASLSRGEMTSGSNLVGQHLSAKELKAK